MIGKRLADAVRRQRDMLVAGVAARSSSFSLRDAQWRGFDVYVTDEPAPGDAASRFCKVKGPLEDLMESCDVLLDATPSGTPAGYSDLYARYPELPIVVQGGENHSFGGVSFNSFTSFARAAGQRRIRVISCSSTGITRLLYALHQAFGVRHAFCSLMRRAADPGKRGKTPANALRPTLGQSHHAADVRSVGLDLNVYSMSVDAPTTFGHVINFQIDLGSSPDVSQVARALDRMPRILVGRGLPSTAALAEFFEDLGRPRRDRPEIYVWERSLLVSKSTVYATISVHMESITIPETIDCIRAALRLEPDNLGSIYQTDCALGIAKERECYLGICGRGLV